jgi:MSHA type pilus biogenesis protein MshL
MESDSLSKFSVQEVLMKYLKYCFVSSSLLLLTLILSSCTTNTQQKEQNSSLAQETVQPVEKAATVSAPALPASLPVRYQTAAYVVDKDEADNILIEEESKLKVGARITSTRGPQPLWDIIKRLASLKGMNVSWASDVDKNVLVDVDINANDDFYQTLDNMLRQVDYFHEMQGSTIIVKYKETRQFQIAMPFIKQTYKTNTGGDVLGGGVAAESGNVAGEISLSSEGVAISQHKDGNLGGVEFNTWNSIENNLNSILNIWTTDEVENTATTKSDQKDFDNANNNGLSSDLKKQEATATFRRSSGANAYFIDKPVGLITATAPRPLLEKLELYIDTLKKELYKQISIEAKIIEVQLNDASSIGINWSNILKDFDINGLIQFGNNDVITSAVGTVTNISGVIHPGSGQFVSNISLADKSFNVLLNALNEQGETKILSNPKISVMNGQPAMITVGRNVTYIDSIESDRDSDTNVVTFTVNTERILSGIGMALTATVTGEDEIIMNLVPITSELQEPILYKDVGFDGGTVGLPIVNVREMSTTVKVKGGEMLVIGGLISDTNQTTGEFAPILGDIPVLKYLFGYEEKQHLKRELIILLRPRII